LVSNFQTNFRSSKRDEDINNVGDEAPATAISTTRCLMSRRFRSGTSKFWSAYPNTTGMQASGLNTGR
jgi:hypothetical protein